MRTYEKIETIYIRDIEGTKKLVPGAYRNDTVRYLRDLPWYWTEKVDGMNVRVCWDGHRVSFGGRTDRAQIPADLVNRLNELFGTEEAEELFEQTFGEEEAILFGEGYGRKIQKGGGDYIPDGVDFILFDLLIGDNYQSRSVVERCATMFGIETVPTVGYGKLEDAVAYVRSHPNSVIAQKPREMEGLVCRPSHELRDRCGNRVIVKIKWNDFKDL